MYSATLPINFQADPGESEAFGVTLQKLPGDKVRFSGEYDDLLDYLCNAVGMSEAEADTEITDEADVVDDPFHRSRNPNPWVQKETKMKTPTLRQLFLTEAPFAADPVGPPAPDAEFDEFEELPSEVEIDVKPAGAEEDTDAPFNDAVELAALEDETEQAANDRLAAMSFDDEEDFMPFGTPAPHKGPSFADTVSNSYGGRGNFKFGAPEEPVHGAAAEEVEEFEDEGPSARTAGSGRAFEGLDPSKRVQEATCFDRFMDKIIIQESTSIQRPDIGLLDSAQRKRAMAHQERPLGRIRYTRGK